MTQSDHGIFGSPGHLFPWDVRFDPEDRAHLDPLADGRVRFRLHAEPVLDSATLVVRRGTVTTHRMRAVGAGRFRIWDVIAGPFDETFEYTFALRTRNGKGVYLVPAGISNAVERLDRWTFDPSLHRHFEVPEWIQGAVVYQIFPDRFRNGDRGNDLPGTVAWDQLPTAVHFQGGDLDGITEKLGYLAGLGVDVIYLNPIFSSPSNHRYDAVDYLSVDPSLGGDVALSRLVESAHRRRVKVVLDVSLNHVHPRFFAFSDLVAKGRRSAYSDWFVVHDWPVRLLYRPHAGHHAWVDRWRSELGVPFEEVEGPGPVLEPTYEAWYGVSAMPRLNLANPAARRYVLMVATHWIEQFDIDGWRMDVARYVDPDFWNDLRAEVKAVKPDAYLLAEVMGHARPWLQGDRFDATMNYTFRDLAVGFFATEEIDGPQLLDGLTRLYGQYAWGPTLANQNLLGSHDTARFLTRAGGDVRRLQLATVLQMTYPGAPGLYYGDEVGLLGGDDPHCRATFPWGSDPTKHELYLHVHSLTKLRRRYRALRNGDWEPLSAARHSVRYRRGKLEVAIDRRKKSAVIVRRDQPIWVFSG